MCVVVGGVEVEVAPMWFCDATRLDGGAPQYRRSVVMDDVSALAWLGRQRGQTEGVHPQLLHTTPSPLSVAPEHPPLLTSRIQPQSAILLYLVI